MARFALWRGCRRISCREASFVQQAATEGYSSAIVVSAYEQACCLPCARSIKSQRGSIQQVRDLFVPSSHSDPILTPGWIELNSAGSSGPRGLEIIENWRNYPGGPIQPNSSGGPTGPGGSEVHFSCIEPDKPGFVYESRKCSSTQSFVTPIEFTIS